MPWILAACLFLAIEGTAFNLTIYINHDIAWILDSASRLLHGGVYGRDIIEPNPPLVWWLATPLVLIVERTGMPVAGSYILSVALLALAVLTVLAFALFRAAALGEFEASAILLTTGFMFFQGAYRDFAQREYLALVLAIPYLLLCRLRLASVKMPSWVAVATGIFAGIAFSLKPYFLAIPLLVELYCIVHGRRLRSLLRVEFFVMMFIGFAYLVGVWVFARPWLTDVVPIASLTFSAFQLPVVEVLKDLGIVAIGFIAIVLLRNRVSDREAFTLLLLADVGFLFSYFIQMKGYTYHAFPIRALTIVGLAWLCGHALDEVCSSERDGPRILARNSVQFIVLGVTLWFTTLTIQSWRSIVGPGGAYHEETHALIHRLNAYPRFLALSTHPYPGFPAALYSESDWVAKTNSRWLLPAVARLRADGRRADPHKRELVEAAAWARLIDDLERSPTVVLVDSDSVHHGMFGESFDILSFYLENPRVRRLWDQYIETEPWSTFRIFVRSSAVVERPSMAPGS